METGVGGGGYEDRGDSVYGERRGGGVNGDEEEGGGVNGDEEDVGGGMMWGYRMGGRGEGDGGV